jgi:RNA polymerase sigma factor (sigma-70 family)
MIRLVENYGGPGGPGGTSGGSGEAVTVGEGAPTSRPPPPPRKTRIQPQIEEKALELVAGGRTNEAFKLLMVAYGDAVRAFILRIVRHEEAAKDLTQQVFTEAFLGITRFQRRSSLWTWLCGIARNRSIDHTRRNRRVVEIDDLDVWRTLAVQQDETMSVHETEKRQALEKCLAKLSPELRAQLMMRFDLGLSFAEIGHEVGDAPGTVQVRVSRALPKLRKCLSGEGAR